MTSQSSQKERAISYRDKIAIRIAEQMILLRGTGETRTVNVGNTYFQIASYDGDQVMIELPSNRFLPEGKKLDDAQELELAAMGFDVPDDDFPNWWIGLDDGYDHDILAAAKTVVGALLKVYRTPMPWLFHAVGMEEDWNRYLRLLNHLPRTRG